MRFIVLVNLFVATQCAKILGIFPSPGYSQFILAERLMQELANRGHSVTVVSAFKPKNASENYRTILVPELLGHDLDFVALERENLFAKIRQTYNLGYYITENTLKNKNVQELLKSKENFDLVIVEHFFIEALTGFAAHFKAHLVLFSSMCHNDWTTYVTGNLFLPSISAFHWTSHTNDMSFFQRITNLVAAIYNFGYRDLIAYPKHQEYLKKYFSTDAELKDIMYNASLLLLNSHVTTCENTALFYGTVEIGGFHIKQEKLPEDLQKFLDNAEEGVILFSLGSNLKSSDLPENTRKEILQAFGQFRQKILWKFEIDLPNKPDNVYIKKWLPQSDVLSHPNVQLFISHGGILSVTEAVFYGVPILGIPFFSDQKMNTARATKAGFAQTLPFAQLSKKTLFAAINETLSNPRYHENARKLSNILRDGPIRPLGSAMYWIEHVLRHGGKQFKPATLNLYWFQIYFIDVLVFFLFSILLVFVAVRKTALRTKVVNIEKGRAEKDKKKKRR